jgi:two-component system, chemotaxis family, protein-glutamate methylesterase/glutaminase
MAVNEERIRRTFFGVGASAGGIEALIGLLDLLPQRLDATIAIVVHRSVTRLSVLTDIFGRHSSMPVSEPEDQEPIRAGRIYLAPRDEHMTVEGDVWRLTTSPPVNRWRPAVDPLLISASKHRGPDVVGVLLSGGGVDGVEGLIEIKKRGGLSIAQDPKQALQGSMPSSAIRYDDVDLILRVEDIATVIPILAAGEVVTAGGPGRGAHEATR